MRKLLAFYFFTLITFIGFSSRNDKFKTDVLSIVDTGLLGQYAHRNELSHQIAYLFTNVKKPWRIKVIVTFIMNVFYSYQPNGLIGIVGCGQIIMLNSGELLFISDKKNILELKTI